MNNARKGLFRIAIETRFITDQNPLIITGQISDVLAPYNLCVWDSEPKQLEIKHPNIEHERGYVDVHVCENELFGEQPILDILKSVREIKGVTAVVFIDTDSVYAIPTFFHLFTTYDMVVKAIKSSYLNETIGEYQKLLRPNVLDCSTINPFL